jgi:hypothetical protein
MVGCPNLNAAVKNSVVGVGFIEELYEYGAIFTPKIFGRYS